MNSLAKIIKNIVKEVFDDLFDISVLTCVNNWDLTINHTLIIHESCTKDYVYKVINDTKL